MSCHPLLYVCLLSSCQRACPLLCGFRKLHDTFTPHTPTHLRTVCLPVTRSTDFCPSHLSFAQHVLIVSVLVDKEFCVRKSELIGVGGGIINTLKGQGFQRYWAILCPLRLWWDFPSHAWSWWALA